jgi:hypothetical protein
MLPRLRIDTLIRHCLGCLFSMALSLPAITTHAQASFPCRNPVMLWNKAFTAQHTGVQISSLAIGPNGEIGFHGTFGGNVDFGTAGIADIHTSAEGNNFISVFHADGSYGWTRVYTDPYTSDFPALDQIDKFTSNFLATPTVAEIVQKAGYRTAIAGSKPVAQLADRSRLRQADGLRKLFAGRH